MPSLHTSHNCQVISAWLAGTVKEPLVLLGTLLHTVPVVSETGFLS